MNSKANVPPDNSADLGLVFETLDALVNRYISDGWSLINAEAGVPVNCLQRAKSDNHFIRQMFQGMKECVLDEKMVSLRMVIPNGKSKRKGKQK